MANKVALLTGATTGIGKATAQILASRGASVVISGRREALGQQTVEEIRAQGGDAAFVVADVNNEADIRQLIEFAVVGLTKSGALDYATQNIRINAVAPGAINTDIIAQQIALGQYDQATVSAMHPMARMGNPEEIAHGIAWLLSDEASFVTGHVLNIDGGFQAK